MVSHINLDGRFSKTSNHDFLLWNHGISGYFWKFPTFLKSWVKEGSSGAKNAIDVVESAVITSCFFNGRTMSHDFAASKDMTIKLQREWMVKWEMRWGIGRNVLSFWKVHVLLLKTMHPFSKFTKFTHTHTHDLKAFRTTMLELTLNAKHPFPAKVFLNLDNRTQNFLDVTHATVNLLKPESQSVLGFLALRFF